MDTFSALLAICTGNSPVTGKIPSQMPVTQSFDVFCDLRLNKRFRKQWWGWWFETPSFSLWRHCNAMESSEFHGFIWCIYDFLGFNLHFCTFVYRHLRSPVSFYYSVVLMTSRLMLIICIRRESTAICLNTVKVRAWVSNYIPLFYVDVITYPCPHPDAGF